MCILRRNRPQGGGEPCSWAVVVAACITASENKCLVTARVRPLGLAARQADVSSLGLLNQ